MSTPGGGQDIGELLRQLGKEAIFREAENAGLSPRADRFRCPFEGCRDKAPEKRSRSAWVYTGKRGEPRVNCGRCNGNGSLVDVLAAVNGWSPAQAIGHLRGLQAPAPKPALRVVPPATPPEDDKLPAKDVQRIWDGLLRDDVEGRHYLEGRGLGEAAELGLVRFAGAAHPNERIRYWAKDKRLVVALLRDVVGEPRGIQGRLARPLRASEDGRKCIGLKGTWNRRAFFGSPELIESAAVIAVAEGLPDYLALAPWAGREVVVVGAAGQGVLHHLAAELERVGVELHGKVFCLFPQNDRPRNRSRAAFERLGQELVRLGARVVMVPTPEQPGVKDVADWLHRNPDASWPPPAVATALGGDVEHESPATQLVPPPQGGLPVPARVTTEVYGQDFSTLCALLDDPLHREAIMGRAGEFSLNLMDESVWYAGQKIRSRDLSRIRLGLELHGVPLAGRKLKFLKTEIADAVSLLGSRRSIHPLQEWATSFRWDGHGRLDAALPRALGHQPGSLEAILLERWMLGACARAARPGCQLDCVLVLIGEEGRHKSGFFRAIAGDEWFTDEPVNQEAGKDGKMILRKKWIIEWAELMALTSARSIESVMAFVSQRQELFRKPYGDELTEGPRHCCFVATTNKANFLAVRKNRRFWPVRILRLDLPWVVRNRDQLIAEAVHRVQAGEQWWLEQELEEQLADHNQEHRQESSWAELLRDWLTRQMATPEYLTVRLALQEVLGKELKHCTRADDMRMAEAIESVGWVEYPRRRYRGMVGHFYLPPGTQFEMDMGRAYVAEREPGQDG